MTDIGYKHGEITFAAPFHVPFGAIAHIDHPFANALSTLTKEHTTHDDLYRRILGAASFFSLANTDDPAMIPEAEIILMGSAFEQLFAGRQGSEARPGVCCGDGGIRPGHS